jgi:hypothetical protein
MWNGDDPEGRFKHNERNFKELFPSAIFPYPLRKVFEKGIYSERDERYQDIEDLKTDLEEIYLEMQGKDSFDSQRLNSLKKRIQKIEEKLEKNQKKQDIIELKEIYKKQMCNKCPKKENCNEKYCCVWLDMWTDFYNFIHQERD